MVKAAAVVAVPPVANFAGQSRDSSLSSAATAHPLLCHFCFMCAPQTAIAAAVLFAAAAARSFTMFSRNPTASRMHAARLPTLCGSDLLRLFLRHLTRIATFTFCLPFFLLLHLTSTSPLLFLLCFLLFFLLLSLPLTSTATAASTSLLVFLPSLLFFLLLFLLPLLIFLLIFLLFLLRHFLPPPLHAPTPSIFFVLFTNLRFLSNESRFRRNLVLLYDGSPHIIRTLHREINNLKLANSSLNSEHGFIQMLRNQSKDHHGGEVTVHVYNQPTGLLIASTIRKCRFNHVDDIRIRDVHYIRQFHSRIFLLRVEQLTIKSSVRIFQILGTRHKNLRVSITAIKQVRSTLIKCRDTITNQEHDTIQITQHTHSLSLLNPFTAERQIVMLWSKPNSIAVMDAIFSIATKNN